MTGQMNIIICNYFDSNFLRLPINLPLDSCSCSWIVDQFTKACRYGSILIFSFLGRHDSWVRNNVIVSSQFEFCGLQWFDKGKYDGFGTGKSMQTQKLCQQECMISTYQYL